MKLKSTAKLIVLAAVFCAVAACSMFESSEKKILDYLRAEGVQADSVVISSRDLTGLYVCEVEVPGLLEGYSIHEIWDIFIDGKQVSFGSMRPMTDSTKMRSVASGIQKTLGDYLEKDYIPHLVDPSFEGSSFIDSLLQDKDLFLRHRNAWLSTVPVGDRSYQQVFGPVMQVNKTHFDENGYERDYSTYKKRVSGNVIKFEKTFDSSDDYGFYNFSKYTYRDGKYVRYEGWEENEDVKYDSFGRVVSSSWGMNSVTENSTREYDKYWNCVNIDKIWRF